MMLVALLNIFSAIAPVTDVESGQPRYEWSGFSEGPPSYVELTRSEEYAGSYTVTFANEPAHMANAVLHLKLDDFEITCKMDWQWRGGDDERLTCDVPEGYYLLPEEIIVPEHDIDSIEIIAILS